MGVHEKIGDRVSKLRKAAGLTQSQIAEFLSVDQTYISKCENGERPFTVDMLERLGDLFGCPLNGPLEEAHCQETLRGAFRVDGIEAQDLAAIADINRIAMNLAQMRKWLEA